MIDFSKLNKLSPEKGRLLISEPFLDDNYFKRSVILLCEHNEEGSFGFVLNNYVKAELEEIVADMKPFETRISIGGPVSTGNLYYIHTRHTIPESIALGNGLYMGGSFEIIKGLLEEGNLQKDEIRFFIGYSGWSPGQLDEELKENSWIVAEAKDPISLMTTDNDKLWEDTLKEMGKKYALIAKFPEDPSLN